MTGQRCGATTPALVVHPAGDQRHVHSCTGPADHDDDEHKCPCGAWWRLPAEPAVDELQLFLTSDQLARPPRGWNR